MKLPKPCSGWLLALRFCMQILVMQTLFVQTLSTQAQAAEPAKPALLVYAAASLTNVLEELGKAYQVESGQAVTFSFAASSALARQIEAGAKADVFFPADTEWMDYLQRHDLLAATSRSNLLGNRLVLIAAADSTLQLTIAQGFAVASALGNGRLSIGDPESVPAGKFARAALTALSAWDSVANRLVLSDSVRSALAFVSRGEAPLGIVYETDALFDKQVRIVDTFPATTHAPIVYPIALTLHARSGASEFIAYLRTPGSQTLFKKYGFSTLPFVINNDATVN
jgi:molybdate transport system substrate-binding protein